MLLKVEHGQAHNHCTFNNYLFVFTCKQMSPLLSRGQVTFTTCYKKKAEFIVAFQKSKTHYGRILYLRSVVFLFNVAISFSFFSTITRTTSTYLNRRDPVQKKYLTPEKVLNKLNKQHSHSRKSSV